MKKNMMFECIAALFVLAACAATTFAVVAALRVLEGM